MVEAMNMAVRYFDAGQTRRAATILRFAGFQPWNAVRFLFQPSFRAKMFALFS